ncbi:MAG: hypothetical protein ABJH28_09520 [Paraglaciecola sp.]|uniref:hypothetical protein n=1 Tax=Paraglaciecola sp. TaxID=1920173 RepID=UPI0032666163
MIKQLEIGATAVRNKNYDKAYKHLEEASKHGDKVSQYTLALLYMEGFGVEQDYGKAYLWLNVASEAKEKNGVMQGFKLKMQCLKNNALLFSL